MNYQRGERKGPRVSILIVGYSFLVVGMVCIVIASCLSLYFGRMDLFGKLSVVEFLWRHKASVVTTPTYSLLGLIGPFIGIVITIAFLYAGKRYRVLGLQTDEEVKNRVVRHMTFFLVSCGIMGTICTVWLWITDWGGVQAGYGRMNWTFHIILSVVCFFAMATEKWTTLKERWRKVEDMDKEAVGEFREYVAKVLKATNRVTLLVLITVAFSSWRLLGSFVKYSDRVQEAVVGAIGFNALVCGVPIMFWVIYPLFRLLEDVDASYYDKMVENKNTKGV